MHTQNSVVLLNDLLSNAPWVESESPACVYICRFCKPVHTQNGVVLLNDLLSISANVHTQNSLVLLNDLLSNVTWVESESPACVYICRFSKPCWSVGPPHSLTRQWSTGGIEAVLYFCVTHFCPFLWSILLYSPTPHEVKGVAHYFAWFVSVHSCFVYCYTTPNEVKGPLNTDFKS